jgi:predicted small metal-binding protein
MAVKRRRRFVCLQAGCETTIEANSDDELIEAVQEHVAAAHDSFELEDFILAGATDADSEQ